MSSIIIDSTIIHILGTFGAFCATHSKIREALIRCRSIQIILKMRSSIRSSLVWKNILLRSQVRIWQKTTFYISISGSTTIQTEGSQSCVAHIQCKFGRFSEGMTLPAIKSKYSVWFEEMKSSFWKPLSLQIKFPNFSSILKFRFPLQRSPYRSTP